MNSHCKFFSIQIFQNCQMNLWYLIFLIFFIAFKIESGKIRQNFDEIFGNAWDQNKSDEKLIKIEQIDQNEQNDNLAAIDQMDGEEMGNSRNDHHAREIIRKFDAIIEKMREKRKYQLKNRNRIECKIGKLLGANRPQIYKWKKEMNLNKNKMMEKSFYEQKKKEFIERFNEFKCLYGQGKQKEFVKELGINEKTFRKWKKELVPKYHKTQIKYSNEDKLTKMKHYFKIIDKNSEITDKMVAKELGIGSATLFRWKKKFSSLSGI